MAASCRAWEARAQKAAYPDAAMIALHDRYAQQAKDLRTAALAQNLHGAALSAAAGQIAQAEIMADDVYDVRSKLQNAAECWRGLGIVKDMHDQMWRDLVRRSDEMRASQAVLTPTALPAQPPHAPVPQPSAPQPSSAPTYDALPTKPTTWGDTPYAPMIPPVMRDQPVDNVNPSVPPIARPF